MWWRPRSPASACCEIGWWGNAARPGGGCPDKGGVHGGGRPGEGPTREKGTDGAALLLADGLDGGRHHGGARAVPPRTLRGAVDPRGLRGGRDRPGHLPLLLDLGPPHRRTRRGGRPIARGGAWCFFSSVSLSAPGLWGSARRPPQPARLIRTAPAPIVRDPQRLWGAGARSPQTRPPTPPGPPRAAGGRFEC